MVGNEKLLNGIEIGLCRDKKLKNTLSWSSNILIRLHFIQKLNKSPHEFALSFKDKLEQTFKNIRVEKSGFIVVIDGTLSEP